MTTDPSVIRDLVEVLEDGRDGFTRAAETLRNDDRSDVRELARRLSEFASQRAGYLDELRAIRFEHGNDVAADVVSAAFHRGWIGLREALSGSRRGPGPILAAAEQGEDYAVAEYARAVQADITPELRVIVERQLEGIRAAHGQVRSLCERFR